MARKRSQHPDAMKARASRARRRALGRPLPADLDAALTQALPVLLVKCGFRYGLQHPDALNQPITFSDICREAIGILSSKLDEDGTPRFEHRMIAAALADRLAVTERHR